MEETLKNFLKNLKTNESTISMFLGALVMVVIAVLILNYLRSTPRPQITEESSSTESGQIAKNENVPDQEIPIANDLQLGNKATKNDNGADKSLRTRTSHNVNKGENLWVIAETYYGSGYNWIDIAKANSLQNPGKIEVNQKLNIPDVASKPATKTGEVVTSKEKADTISGTDYIIKKGDTLWDVAVRAYADGYRWVDIWKTNRNIILNPDYVEIGQVIKLPR